MKQFFCGIMKKEPKVNRMAAAAISGGIIGENDQDSE